MTLFLSEINSKCEVEVGVGEGEMERVPVDEKKD